MENPWIMLPTRAPYVLGMDKDWVETYQNKLFKSANRKKILSHDQIIFDRMLRTDITPFPYYGNPQEAAVFVLQANPGYDSNWDSNSLTPLILGFDRKNLLHQNDVPLCYTQPDYANWQYNDGKRKVDWYWQRTRQLRERVGWEAVANRLMYLEMFPYRSIKLMRPKTLPPSQQYTFHLLRKALRRNVLVVISRMEKQWLEYIPELKEYKNTILLKNKRNVVLSPGNMSDGSFEKLCATLR